MVMRYLALLLVVLLVGCSSECIVDKESEPIRYDMTKSYKYTDSYDDKNPTGRDNTS